MSFISIEFVALFALTCSLFFLLPTYPRILFLVLVSYLFYGFWNPSYIFLILTSTLVDYTLSLLISKTDNQKARVSYLVMSIVTNLSILFVFKYYNFFMDSLTTMGTFMGFQVIPPSLEFLLPVGISFYTFQSIAYTIDVFRGEVEPEQNLLVFMAYIAFFPQLVAGPIERASNMLPQFRQNVTFDYTRIVEGLRLVMWGTIKKVVIGDRLGVYVNQIYGSPEQYTGLPFIVATVFFAFQIYCDFSGYSDIAIGVAKILGFDLMENFRQPYFSRSISEFWRRWHISLSTWFRDYLYIPLGGNRVTLTRNLFNLMVVFVVSGLWHGANWTFVIWGAIHGIILCVEVLQRQITTNWMQRIRQLITPFQVAITFLIVSLAWVFFRADNLTDALYILRTIPAIDVANFQSSYTSLSPNYLLISTTLIGVLLIMDWLDSRYNAIKSIEKVPTVVRWSLYYVAVAAIFVALNSNIIIQEFIYFQF